MSPYAFSENKPPRLSDHPNPFDIPPEQLTEVIGKAEWQEDREWSERLGFFENYFRVYQTSVFSMERVQYWAIKGVVEHFAEDETRVVTVVSGYDETRTREVEKTLNLEASAAHEVPFWKLSASVKAGLKITEAFEQRWHQQKTTQTTITYKAGYTYVVWELRDAIRVKKTTFGQKNHDGYAVQMFPPTEVTDSVESVIAIFNDRALDKQYELIDTMLPVRYRIPLERQQVDNAKLGKPGPEIIWWASCQSGHAHWNGPDRKTQSAAEDDKEDHDNDSHGGKDTAVVLSTEDP